MGCRFTFIVDIRSMEYYIHTVSDAHLHRITGPRMGANHPAVPVSLVHAGCCFFIGEVAVLRCSNFRDLPFT